MAKRLGFPPAAPGAEVFDVFILPRSFEALCRRIDGTPLFAQRLTASVEFLERTAAAARPNVSPIFLVNDDEERLMAIVAYLLEGRDAEIGYAVTTDGRPTHV